MNEAKTIADYCNDKFAGWTIKSFGCGGFGYVWFTLSKGEQEKVAWLLSDPEGNGVGFIEEGNESMSFPSLYQETEVM